MSSSIRLLILVFLTAAALRAQETPSPSPSPTATPAPAASPSPSPSSSPATADSAPAADATPAPSATPSADQAPAPDATPEPASSESAPAPTATPSEDVIPIEAPSLFPGGSGAPLDTQDLAPALPDAAYTDPNAIISDEPPAPPSLPAAIENLQQKERLTSIRYREVRVEAEKDPKVVNMLKQADTATTTEDKRAAQREYYRLLFKKMVSIDSSLADRCAQMQAAYLRRLAQERAEPTIPLNPPPTPEPLPN